MVCSAVPCAASGVIGTAPCAKEKQKRDVQLTTCAPRFLFLVGKPSQSSLTRCQLPRKGELYAQVRESGTFDWEEA